MPGITRLKREVLETLVVKSCEEHQVCGCTVADGDRSPVPLRTALVDGPPQHGDMFTILIPQLSGALVRRIPRDDHPPLDPGQDQFAEDDRLPESESNHR